VAPINAMLRSEKSDEPDLLISPERQAKLDEQRPEYTPEEGERKRVGSIKEKYESSRRAKAPYERTWFINGCFVVGHQYVTWNDLQRMFDVPMRMSPFRVRLVVNIVLAYFRRTKARLTGAKPGIWVRPASTDEKDVERARNQDRVLEYELERLNHQERLKEGVGWMLEASCFFYHLKWNPQAGPVLFQQQPVVDPQTGQPAIDPESGQPQMESVPLTDEYGRQVHRGENELEIKSPFEVAVDPRAASEDDAEWIILAAVKSLTWIRDNYPEKGKFVTGKKEWLNDLYQNRLRGVVGLEGGEQGQADNVDAMDDAAVVYDYREKPTLEHPEGQWIVCAGDVELFKGPNPYKHKQFALVRVGEIMIPGRFWPMSMIEQIIPLQKNFNRGRSQEVENRTVHGRPKLLVPKVCKLRQDSFDSEPGEKIEYASGPRGEKPELMHPPSTAMASMQETAQTMSDIQEVASWHEVSRGILPSANIPGVGIDKLQMADDTSLGDTASNIDNGISKLGKLLLSNCAQFWDEERMVRAGGEAARMEAMEIRGDDLLGQDPTAVYDDVQVKPMSTLLKDPAKNRENVKSMILDMGVLDPILHREKILKMLDVKDIDEIFADDHLDQQRAQRENEIMEKGQLIIPRDFENHEIHMRVLDRFRKGERYRRLPKQIQQIFDTHALLHVQVATTVMMQRQQATMAAGGGAPMGPDGKPAEEGAPPPAGGPSGATGTSGPPKSQGGGQ